MAIKPENYITVQGWMSTDLKLKGTRLLIYAIIYGFSQTESQEFTGSLQYLMDWTNSSKPGVINNLKALVADGMLEKKERTVNGVKKVSYRANKFTGGGKESLPAQSNKFTGGGKESLPNNISNKDSDNLPDKKGEDGNPPPPPEPKPTEATDFGSLSPRMISAVEKWLQYKKERREGYKPTGLQALITQIENNVKRYGEEAVIDLIGECMAANWQGIIFDKLKNRPQRPPQSQQQKSGGDRLLEMIRRGDFDE